MPHSHFAIHPVSPTLGAEISGIDLSQPLDPAAAAGLAGALDRHLVLVFRGQTLSDADLVRVSGHFGPLDKAPVTEHGRLHAPGFEEVYVISNVTENGRPIGALGAGESVWHADMTYLETPPYASSLYALEVPAEGGDTGFLSMFAAYDALPAALKRRAEGLSIKHDSTTNSGGYLRQGFAPPADLATSPGTVHPLVITHPATGAKALLLGRRPHAYIPGLAVADSEALLDEIWAAAIRPELAWHHRWRVGDLVMWDNRWTMHRRDPFPDDQRRRMHRTQIAVPADAWNRSAA
ncbi:TauD/TfdA dioxygenase family protein [Azospirillum picis]|uniref:Taurine dioxygenase n=1 Tax=Azospirillum picis TaxID=488438 RepID=A0ABU0MMN4_9PROT|nr:TauD/TfdA family dioxygenase [Azospirillum picis]MBP2300761.1 taurine dioxygenase [Azospirillum picis]MDQ0534730.1 taurine dioxygenase [Azospirillum picis]